MSFIRSHTYLDIAQKQHTSDNSQYTCHNGLELVRNRSYVVCFWPSSGLCLATVMRCYCKPFSQWQHSFQMKAVLPLAKRLVTAWHTFSKTRPCPVIATHYRESDIHICIEKYWVSVHIMIYDTYISYRVAPWLNRKPLAVGQKPYQNDLIPSVTSISHHDVSIV